MNVFLLIYAVAHGSCEDIMTLVHYCFLYVLSFIEISEIEFGVLFPNLSVFESCVYFEMNNVRLVELS